MVSGIYFIILAFEMDIKKRYLFLSGFFLACSVGSRAINVFPVIFIIILTLYWIWKSQRTSGTWNEISQLVDSLITPLILGALMIGWYNWARFGSPFEFGLRYQITIYNLSRDIPLTFQPDYVPFDLYAYIFKPFEFIAKFHANGED